MFETRTISIRIFMLYNCIRVFEYVLAYNWFEWTKNMYCNVFSLLLQEVANQNFRIIFGRIWKDADHVGCVYACHMNAQTKIDVISLWEKWRNSENTIWNLVQGNIIFFCPLINNIAENELWWNVSASYQLVFNCFNQWFFIYILFDTLMRTIQWQGCYFIENKMINWTMQ